MNQQDTEELNKVKAVCDTFVGFYYTADNGGNKIREGKQFKDVISFGKYLVDFKKKGGKRFHNVEVDILLKWMRKSSKNLIEPHQVMWQKNLFHNDTDRIIVSGKSSVKIKRPHGQ